METGTVVVETEGFFKGCEFVLTGEFTGTHDKWGERKLIAPVVPKAPKVPAHLQIANLNLSSDWVKYLRTPKAKCLLYFKVRDRHIGAEVCEQYRRLSGEELVEGKGYDVVSTENKWGVEGHVSFVPNKSTPADILALESKPGFVNRKDVVWQLVKEGLKVTR
jgi:hypothetical protein